MTLNNDRFTQGSLIGTDPVRGHGTLIGTDWLPPPGRVQEGGKIVMMYPADGPGVTCICTGALRVTPVHGE